MVKSIRGNLARRKRNKPITPKRLPQIISDHKQDIIEEWYRDVEKDPYMKTIKLSREERIDHLPELLDELVRQGSDPDSQIHPHAWDAADKHGIRRRQQGYSIPMLIEETRVLHHVIAECAQHNLLLIDVSNLVPDLVAVDDTIHQMLRHSADAFLKQSSQAA
jgi:hypothetical protein